MKIAVLTFWESQNNYGQILQLFALQRYLREMGHEPYVVKYYRIPSYSTLTNIKRLARKMFALGSQKRPATSDYQQRDFDAFRNKYIQFGEDVYRSVADLGQNPPDAGAYICGSDQVWNNKLAVPCKAFLLNFGSADTLRISYAASFGQKQLDSETFKMFKSSLPNFDAVSVREDSGTQICSSLGYSNAQWVLDPTMLFDRYQWISMLNLHIQHEPSKTFIYTLGNSSLDGKDNFVSHFRSFGSKTVEVSANNDFTGNDYPTIEEWLQHIASSDFVITSSFHGVVFCIIFNRNFIALPNTGNATGMNERLLSLLKRLDLSDHIMPKYDPEIVENLRNKSVNWAMVNSRIAEWKVTSANFLEDALSKRTVTI